MAGGSGFPPHPHNNMEIVTFLQNGAIPQRAFPHSDRGGDFTVLASGAAERGDGLEIRADARMAAATPADWALGGGPVTPSISGRDKGRVNVKPRIAEAGDGIAATGASTS
ncbi:hypothetical protein [Pseudopontixanthobacter vadosimaris]|uniref:hypothetical protein n=1 Tax=Pseudopontixanthobacter vadosimaris TaxID=2726450 RepID=UPI0030B9022B